MFVPDFNLMITNMVVITLSWQCATLNKKLQKKCMENITDSRKKN